MPGGQVERIGAGDRTSVGENDPRIKMRYGQQDRGSTYSKNASVFVYLTILCIEFHGIGEYQLNIFAEIQRSVVLLPF